MTAEKKSWRVNTGFLKVGVGLRGRKDHAERGVGWDVREDVAGGGTGGGGAGGIHGNKQKREQAGLATAGAAAGVRGQLSEGPGGGIFTGNMGDCSN